MTVSRHRINPTPGQGNPRSGFVPGQPSVSTDGAARQDAQQRKMSVNRSSALDSTMKQKRLQDHTWWDSQTPSRRQTRHLRSQAPQDRRRPACTYARQQSSRGGCRRDVCAPRLVEESRRDVCAPRFAEGSGRGIWIPRPLRTAGVPPAPMHNNNRQEKDADETSALPGSLKEVGGETSALPGPSGPQASRLHPRTAAGERRKQTRRLRSQVR